LRAWLIVLSLLVLAVSGLLTGVVRRLALSHGLVDVPNSRSSHTRTTPRGGGLAVVFTSLVYLILLYVAGVISRDFLLIVAIGGGAVALIGFLDDRYSVHPGVRVTVQLAAALWALSRFGGLPPLQFGEQVIQLAWGGYVVGALGIVWVVNLFNFMDGIDGIAASEAIFITCAGALLGLLGGDAREVVAGGWVFALVCVGFLFWNWPPAKIFLGDVGSGYLGYVIAVLALAAARTNPVALWTWLILGGVFFVDATVTLARRVLRGERAFSAHRSHAYQRLARRWHDHGKVTLAVMLVNIVWLLPCAWFETAFPQYAAPITALALAPLAVLAIGAGAGRSEAG
jgi:Fuc2NAc and GlcNAc transferase